jgi:hypothetical protein
VQNRGITLEPPRKPDSYCVTKRAPATKAQVQRNIKAARLEGLHIAGIRPDGTVIVRDGDIPPSPLDCGLDEPAASISKWEDIEA